MSDWYESIEDIDVPIQNEDIITFDGISHDKEELLEKMMDDDFYYGYLGKQALSSSSLKTLLKSPKLYVKSLTEGDIETQPLRDGKMFHWSILEPDKFEGIEIVDIKSRNTNKFRCALEEAITAGRSSEVYTSNERNVAINLKKELLKNVEASKYLEDAEFEVPAISMVDGIPFRGKADIVKGNKIIDFENYWRYCKV